MVTVDFFVKFIEDYVVKGDGVESLAAKCNVTGYTVLKWCRGKSIPDSGDRDLILQKLK